MTQAQALTFALEATSGLVQRWTLEVYSAADDKSPRASKSAPTLTLVGATSGQKVDAATPASNITTTAPATGYHSYIVRSTVNGGLNAKGQPDPDLVHERLIAIRTPGGRRKIIASEGTQYGPGGWADAQNDDVDSTPGVAPVLPYIDPSAYGAIGDGIVSDNAAVLSAITAGIAANKPVNGLGKTYAITGNLTLVSDAWLENITFKQLTPAAGTVRTLTSAGGSNIKLVNVTVSRNGSGANGSLGSDAGIWVEGGSGHYFEDVEVYGDDVGSGFVAWGASGFDVVRLHVHDINYALGSDPGDDRVQGFWFNNCADFRVVSPRVHDLGGNYGAGQTTKWNRSAFSGCDNFDLVDAQVSDVDQGIDLTGSVGNTNFRILGGCAKDCFSAGWKFANSAKGGVVTGATSERCDLYGFFVSGPAEAALPIKSGDITFINCTAFDTGSAGNWTGGIRPAGFAIEVNDFDVAISPLGVRFIDCIAHDRQAVPTMKYGFVNEVARPSDGQRLNQCIDCVSIGHTTSAFSGMHDAADVAWQPNAQFPTKGKLPSIELVEHFTSVAGMRGLTTSFSGTSASVADEDNDSSARVGIVNCRTGTDTTGRAGIVSRVNALRFGGGRHRLRWDAFVTALSDGTNTFATRLGFLDSISGEPTNGVFFRYTHSVNGGEWQAVTRAAGTETATDTNVAASAAWAYFEIEVNAAGTSVAFYINGALVATNTTNIPTGSNLTGIGTSHIKSAGTSGRELRLDMMAYSFEPAVLL